MTEKRALGGYVRQGLAVEVVWTPSVARRTNVVGGVLSAEFHHQRLEVVTSASNISASTMVSQTFIFRDCVMNCAYRRIL